jgi:hypothetical protein
MRCSVLALFCQVSLFFSPLFLGWTGNESTITEATTGLLYQPWMMDDDDECGALGGMLGRRN